jgi:hypothetical protein
LQELAPSTPEYSPSPVHGVQVSVAPGEAVPAGQISAAVLSELVLCPAGAVVQYEAPEVE